MRRILAIAITGIIFGVVMNGAGVAGATDIEFVKSVVSSGVSVGMTSNASFLAPMPVNCSVIPVEGTAYALLLWHQAHFHGRNCMQMRS